MFQSLALLLLVIPAFAANNPLESDFPDGYWDREVGGYGGRSAPTYNLNVAVEEPARARAEVESALRAAGGKLTNFTDQTASIYPTGAEYGGMVRLRPAYMISFQMPEAKAAAVARKLTGLGRLISYNTQSPFVNPQMKELDERVDWIEKEMKRSAEALKTMPVARALLESKLKRLKANRDGVRSTLGIAAISVQITREDPEQGAKPAAATVP